MTSFRVFDYNMPLSYDDTNETESIDSDDSSKYHDNTLFKLQMFGINEKGETCSIMVNNYLPFFYIKVGDHWKESHKKSFISFINNKIGNYYSDNIVSAKLARKHKLYGFDNKRLHNFVEIKFKNISTYNKVKYLWSNKG